MAKSPSASKLWPPRLEEAMGLLDQSRLESASEVVSLHSELGKDERKREMEDEVEEMDAGVEEEDARGLSIQTTSESAW